MKSISFRHRPSVQSPVLSVRWTFNLIPEFTGAYVPVENAVAAYDAASGKLQQTASM